MSKNVRSFTNSLPIRESQIKGEIKEQPHRQDLQFDDETSNKQAEENVEVNELDTLIQQAVADFLAGRYEEV